MKLTFLICYSYEPQTQITAILVNGQHKIQTSWLLTASTILYLLSSKQTSFSFPFSKIPYCRAPLSPAIQQSSSLSLDQSDASAEFYRPIKGLVSSSIPGGGVGSWRWVGRRQHFEAGRQSLDLAEHATASEPALDRGQGTAGRPVSDCVRNNISS